MYHLLCSKETFFGQIFKHDTFLFLMPLCYNFNVLSDSQIMLNLLICQFGGSSIFVQWLGWVGAFTNIVLDTPRGIWARTDAKLDFCYGLGNYFLFAHPPVFKTGPIV